MSGSPASVFSSRSISLLVSAIELVLQQGHVDQQLGPVGGGEELVLHQAPSPTIDSANSATVSAMVSQRQRIAGSSSTAGTAP